MYEHMLSEMARQHVRELQEEAAVERLARSIKASKRRSKPPKASRANLVEAIPRPSRG